VNFPIAKVSVRENFCTLSTSFMLSFVDGDKILCVNLIHAHPISYEWKTWACAVW